MSERTTEILIVGCGTGGVAAALAALRLGKRVILTEESDWIGGQLTSQAVPPDEHPWIETTGCTASYRRFRQGVRNYYWRNYPVTEAARHNMLFNPGEGNVSRLCHEPKVALAVLQEMVAPYTSSRQLEILYFHRPIALELDGDSVRSVTLFNEETGDELTIQADYVLDATELGDLLELGEIEHLIGAESQEQTGELHAVPGDPQPNDQQAITWCFALDYLPDEDHTIAKPANYEFWRDYQADFWPGRQLGWRDVDPQTLETRERGIFHGPRNGRSLGDFWHYRRILYREHFASGFFPSDLCLVNWPHNDYWLGPLVGVDDEEKANNLAGAAQLSLALLYWMQTEAPRHDGGYGYRGLRLRPDVVGTSDGLAKHVYIREARRILAEFTVLEEHVGVKQRGNLIGAERFHDTVGVGSYRIDLHPSTTPRTYVDISSWPFQIPLGALIAQRVENLLPACKNLGVTHITNGCYRLHPVEWNIGEAAGALAAYCVTKGLVPRQVRNDATHLADFQEMLADRLGFVLEWPEYARLTAR